MTEVGMFEAKTHFSELAKRVKAGEEITVTNRGEPILVMVPFKREYSPDELKAIIASIRAQAASLPGPSITIDDILAMRDEGRK